METKLHRIFPTLSSCVQQTVARCLPRSLHSLRHSSIPQILLFSRVQKGDRDRGAGPAQKVSGVWALGEVISGKKKNHYWGHAPTMSPQKQWHQPFITPYGYLWWLKAGQWSQQRSRSDALSLVSVHHFHWRNILQVSISQRSNTNTWPIKGGGLISGCSSCVWRMIYRLFFFKLQAFLKKQETGSLLETLQRHSHFFSPAALTQISISESDLSIHL